MTSSLRLLIKHFCVSIFLIIQLCFQLNVLCKLILAHFSTQRENTLTRNNEILGRDISSCSCVFTAGFIIGGEFNNSVFDELQTTIQQ